MKTQKESLGKTFRRKARRFFGIKKNTKENYIELNIKAHGHGKAREFSFTIFKLFLFSFRSELLRTRRVRKANKYR